MWIRIIYAQKKRLVLLSHEFSSALGIIAQLFAGEIRVGNLFVVERKSGCRIDVQLADDPGSVACLFQAPDQVWSVFPVKPKLPCSQADLAVLVRVKPG